MNAELCSKIAARYRSLHDKKILTRILIYIQVGVDNGEYVFGGTLPQ